MSLSTPSLGITIHSKWFSGDSTHRWLSTPSLGITESLTKAVDTVLVKLFQLPLSGSLIWITIEPGEITLRPFQLPLSGSHGQRGSGRSRAYRAECFQLPLSGSHLVARSLEFVEDDVAFNSLSRDHGITAGACRAHISSPDACTFNSLSRDHRSCGACYVNCHVNSFQLPLSGSPSPIPGFSGSPRLPAAAPLRTSVSSGHYLKI